MSFVFKRTFIASLFLLSASTSMAEFCVSAEYMVPRNFLELLLDRIEFFNDLALHPEKHQGGYAPCLWDEETSKPLHICVRCDGGGTDAIKCFVMFPHTPAEYGIKSWLSFPYTKKALLMAKKDLQNKINSTNTGTSWFKIENAFGAGNARLDCSLDKHEKSETLKCVVVAVECLQGH